MKRFKMLPNNTRGLLITFCGMDGCGKSTIIDKVLQELAQSTNEFRVTKQPTESVRKSLIFRTFMDSPDPSSYEYRSLSLMAASDRIQHVNKVILPDLEKGKIVISDRYYYSCAANLWARGYTEDKWIYEIAQQIICPDVAFFFDVPVETAVQRVRSRKEEAERYIDMELQYKLRDNYIKIAKKNNGILLSTLEPLDVTFEKVMKSIYKIMEAKYGVV